MFFVDFIFPLKKAYAHCDIPCGVYDPKPAQMAAETVEKMVSKLINFPVPTSLSKKVLLDYTNSTTRMVQTKEEQSEICKKEILILWTDFFNEENYKDYPGLHELVWKTTKLCSQNKREVSLEASQELRDCVAEISEIFIKVKANTNK